MNWWILLGIPLLLAPLAASQDGAPMVIYGEVHTQAGTPIGNVTIFAWVGNQTVANTTTSASGAYRLEVQGADGEAVRAGPNATTQSSPIPYAHGATAQLNLTIPMSNATTNSTSVNETRPADPPLRFDAISAIPTDAPGIPLPGPPSPQIRTITSYRAPFPGYALLLAGAAAALTLPKRP